MKALAASLICVLVVSCAAPRMNTASGKPEVDLVGVSVDAARSYFVNNLLDRGYTPKTSDPLLLVFEKPVDSTAAFFFGSTIYDPQAWGRIRFNIIDRGNGSLRVVANAAIVANRGSAFERETEATGDWKRIQDWLHNAKSILESKPDVATKQ